MIPSTLRIGYRYRAKRLAPDYDAIVIGSGMGGLTTAALLSELDWKVCVLEQHYTAGGYTHSYNRGEYEWDVGVHYIGDVGRPGHGMARTFEAIGDGSLRWEDMGEVYDRVHIGADRYDFVKGRDAWQQRMGEYFPDDHDAIARYLEMIDQARNNCSATITRTRA